MDIVDEGNYYRSTFRDYVMWVAIVLVQVGIIAVIELGLKLIIGSLSFFTGTIMATAIWVVLIFFWGGVDLFVVSVDDFYGAVLVNRWRSYKQPGNNPMSLGDTKALEEISQGYHAKWPWQSVTLINLKRQIPVEMETTAYSSDGVETTISSVMVAKALRGYLCNLARNTEKESVKILVSGVESQLEAKINSQKEAETMASMNRIKDWFGEIYGGDDESSEIERRCGLVTSELTIRQVTRSKSYQEAVESVAIATKTAEAVRAIRAVDPDNIDGRRALGAVLATEGDADYKVFDVNVRGLENLTTIGNVTVGSENTGPAKNKGKGGKKGGSK